MNVASSQSTPGRATTSISTVLPLSPSIRLAASQETFTAFLGVLNPLPVELRARRHVLQASLRNSRRDILRMQTARRCLFASHNPPSLRGTASHIVAPNASYPACGARRATHVWTGSSWVSSMRAPSCASASAGAAEPCLVVTTSSLSFDAHKEDLIAGLIWRAIRRCDDRAARMGV